MRELGELNSWVPMWLQLTDRWTILDCGSALANPCYVSISQYLVTVCNIGLAKKAKLPEFLSGIFAVTNGLVVVLRND
jgi:hypothetical protein